MTHKTPILLNTQAQDLIFSDSRAAGIIAKSKDGETMIHARKGVILASGGFGANHALIKKLDPRLDGLPTNCNAANTGDMILAAVRAGINTVDLKEIQCLPGPPEHGKIRVRFHNDTSRFILVNSKGQRFVDERDRRDVIKEKILSEKNKSFFCIIDQDGLKSYDLLVQRDAIRAVETGDAFKADTIEELATMIDVPPETLSDEIKKRNAAVNATTPNRRLFPISKAPFWAAPVSMRIHYTMGGLCIDSNANCLKENKPVKGLFAAGEITGGIHGKNRIGGNGLADAFTFGLIAAESAFHNTSDTFSL